MPTCRGTLGCCSLLARILIASIYAVTLMMIVCNTLADAVVIIATWIRTFALVRFHGRRNQQRRSIAWLLLRDGQLSRLVDRTDQQLKTIFST